VVPAGPAAIERYYRRLTAGPYTGIIRLFMHRYQPEGSMPACGTRAASLQARPVGAARRVKTANCPVGGRWREAGRSGGWSPGRMSASRY